VYAVVVDGATSIAFTAVIGEHLLIQRAATELVEDWVRGRHPSGAALGVPSAGPTARSSCCSDLEAVAVDLGRRTEVASGYCCLIQWDRRQDLQGTVDVGGGVSSAASARCCCCCYHRHRTGVVVDLEGATTCLVASYLAMDDDSYHLGSHLGLADHLQASSA